MESLHHKPVKRFYLDGDIYDDAAIPRLKIEYVKLLMLEMKLSGYVVRVDIDPDFTIKYNSEKEIFEFKLSLYAVYVGKRKSEWIAGVDGTTVIYTPQSRSKEFSQEVV
jgi:hypothetical protein